MRSVFDVEKCPEYDNSANDFVIKYCFGICLETEIADPQMNVITKWEYDYCKFFNLCRYDLQYGFQLIIVTSRNIS